MRDRIGISVWSIVVAMYLLAFGGGILIFGIFPIPIAVTIYALMAAYGANMLKAGAFGAIDDATFGSLLSNAIYAGCSFCLAITLPLVYYGLFFLTTALALSFLVARRWQENHYTVESVIKFEQGDYEEPQSRVTKIVVQR